MYKVLGTYRRFDQKNNMIFRPHWDSSQDHIVALREETQLKQIKHGVVGFSLEEYALASACSVGATTLGTGINKPDSGLTSWERLSVNLSHNFEFPKDSSALSDTSKMTKRIKRVARYLGADLVGIAELDMRWVYSHHYMQESGQSKPVEIDQRYKYVVSMGLAMDYNMIRTAPSALKMAEVLRVYSKMAFVVASIAQFIRYLGYHAIPSLNDTALNIPIAVDAGLGELGRLGLLITPSFGPRQRLCKVITDLPLQPDHPIDFGVTEFCKVCRKCAQACPAQAISSGVPTTEVSSISNSPGVLKWPLSAEKCREYWSKVGTDCSICIRVCPFNKSSGWIHDMSRWFVKQVPPAHPFMIRMDKLMGYGKYLAPGFFWRDK